MSSASSPAPRPSPVPWGVALAAASLLVIGGGAVIWAHREQPAGMPDTPTTPPSGLPSASLRVDQAPLPLPEPGSQLHAVNYGVENGTRVVKIKVTPNGDELVVDAATGRLLETRPTRPTAPPPMGKFAAPFDPMT